MTRTTLQYLEQVETFFLAQCGRGLMVSPADAQLVGELEAGGVPVDVVCRGIAHAFAARRDERAFGGQAPRSIRGCQGFIDVEVQAWRNKDVGRNEWQSARDLERNALWLAELLSRIEGAGRQAGDPVRGHWRRAWRGVRDLQTRVERDPRHSATVQDSLRTLEAHLCSELLGSLAPIEAMQLRRSAEGRVIVARELADSRAYADAHAAALHSTLRERFGLFSLLPENV